MSVWKSRVSSFGLVWVCIGLARGGLEPNQKSTIIYCYEITS